MTEAQLTGLAQSRFRYQRELERLQASPYRDKFRVYWITTMLAEIDKHIDNVTEN